MKDIEFSYNWNNKLENNCYSTIRIHNEKKYVSEKLYNIYLKNEFLLLISIISFSTSLYLFFKFDLQILLANLHDILLLYSFLRFQQITIPIFPYSENFLIIHFLIYFLYF